MAEAIYGVPAEVIRKGAKEDHDQRMITMRDVGKTTMLSSQYGIGSAKFSNYLLRNNLRLAPDLADHEAKAAEINWLYNRKYAAIAKFRKVCGNIACNVLATPGARLDNWTPAKLTVLSSYDVGGGLSAPAIILPNGFPLVYPKLRYEDNNLVYSLYKGEGRWEDKRLYGGALFNNITQGLAFAVLAWQGVEIDRRIGRALYANTLDNITRVALNVHDEWVVVVPLHRTSLVEPRMLEILRTAPPWAPGLPLGAEIRMSECFD